MNRYEILLLAVPHMTEDEAGAIERGIEKIVKEVPGSTIVSYDKCGKCKLAYAIGDHEYGLYFLVRFELADPKKVFDAIHALLTMKYSDSVIRYLVKLLGKNEPAVYVRQEIVEESSTGDVRDFLRKNKMEGLSSFVEGEAREGREGREPREPREFRGDRGDRGPRGDRGDRGGRGGDRGVVWHERHRGRQGLVRRPGRDLQAQAQLADVLAVHRHLRLVHRVLGRPGDADQVAVP